MLLYSCHALLHTEVYRVELGIYIHIYTDFLLSAWLAPHQYQYQHQQSAPSWHLVRYTPPSHVKTMMLHSTPLHSTPLHSSHAVPCHAMPCHAHLSIYHLQYLCTVQCVLYTPVPTTDHVRNITRSGALDMNEESSSY